MGESRSTSIEPNVYNACQVSDLEIRPKVNNTGQACGESLPMFSSVLFLATYVTQIVEHKSKLILKSKI